MKKVTKESEFIDKTLKTWLKTVDAEQRKKFWFTLYEIVTLLINYLLFTFIQVICLSVPALILPMFVRCLMIKTMEIIVIKIA